MMGGNFQPTRRRDWPFGGQKTEFRRYLFIYLCFGDAKGIRDWKVIS
jgi:hypothetical protein